MQETPEPAYFWTTAHLGGRDRLRSGEDQFSRRPFVSSTHDHSRSVQLIRSRGEHRPREGACHREGPRDRAFDPKWTLPSLAGSNPLVWMAEVNGLLVDLRMMPREVQEVAFAKAIIPYIPADTQDRS